MPNIILFDDPVFRKQLLPFTYTRPVAAIRCGIFTISEKWGNWFEHAPSYQTEPYLQKHFPLITAGDNLYINGSLCPDDAIVESIVSLDSESRLLSGAGEILALRTNNWTFDQDIASFETQTYHSPITMIRHVWDIFILNGAQIRTDFDYIKSARTSELITDPHTRCYNPGQIFIEKGADIKAAILNAETGPIYIGKDSFVQEGASIQGPFSLGQGSTVAQNAKVRMNTSIGPFCKVGGEINGSVLFGYSNKGHDGYLGNSVLGEWCNLGANTNNSNLKNDHTNVQLFNYRSGMQEDTGLQLCGLFMGDYSKAGISTMFNTGTVVGVNVNVFGGGFQPKHIPSFSWGGKAEGFAEYRFSKALSVARDTVNRRGVTFDEISEGILADVFEQTCAHREYLDS